LVGDRTSGAIYTMSADTYTNADGVGIRWMRRTAATQREQAPERYDALRLFVEAGLGLQTGQGSDPQVCLRYSDDGGKTWSNELWRSVGLVGQYKHLVEWNRLGRSRYPRQWEITGSDPIAWRILGAWLNPQRIGGTRAA
jgi:Neuraminidase (sialidase)